MDLDLNVRHASLFREGAMKIELAVQTTGDWRNRQWSKKVGYQTVMESYWKSYCWREKRKIIREIHEYNNASASVVHLSYDIVSI